MPKPRKQVKQENDLAHLAATVHAMHSRLCEMEVQLLDLADWKRTHEAAFATFKKFVSEEYRDFRDLKAASDKKLEWMAKQLSKWEG